MKKVPQIIFLLILSILMFIYSKDISENIISSIEIWKNNLFPSLFPFIVISKILINYGFISFISNIFYNIMLKVFFINPNTSFIFIMSMISGFPSSAKYTKELLDKNIINENDANRIILFSHFANPAFILIALNNNYFNNYKITLLILFSHYFTNIIIGLITKKEKPIVNKNYCKLESKPFSIVLSEAIKDALSTLFLILGTLVTYSIIITIFNKIPINIYYKSILTGFIELTNGLKSISILNIPLRLKASLMTMIISFGGLAIHTQVISIIKINYPIYLKYRFFHAFISFIITYFLFNLIYLQ